MGAKGSVQTLDTLKADLQARRATGMTGMTWRAIAADFPGAPPGTLCAIAKGREPKGARVREALGLPALAPAPVCRVHGVVHARQCRVVPDWVSRGADFLAARERR